MKASIICSNTYTEPAAWGRPAPVPRGVYDGAAGQRTLADALEQARLAESVGFDWVSVSEHHFVPLMCTPNAAVWAGALSQVVTRATIAWLGPIASINNPVRVAEEIAMLDQLTGGGRLIVAPLRGIASEHALYNNIDPADSRAITEEAMLLIRRALTETEPFAWRGAHFDFPVVSVWPGATTAPHPPLYSSGNSRESVQFAARHRFPIALSFRDTPQVAELAGEFQAAARAAGWTPGPDDILYRAWIALGESDAHAEELRAQFLRRDAAPRAGPPGAPGGGTGFGSVRFCGGPETVAGQLRAFRAATGAGVVDLSFGRGPQASTLAAIRRFGELVLPLIRDT